MRATAQDPEAARLMGINVNQTISLTFLLGGMLAGAAGLVYALYETNVWYFQGFKAGLIAFTAAVMGGIGNVRGAVLGGLIIGVIQALSDARHGPAVDRGGRVRLPHRDHDPAATRSARRGDEGGRMSATEASTRSDTDRRLRQLRAQLREWRAGDRAPAAAVVRRAAWPASLVVIGILLPFLFSNNSGFMNATIIALAFAVMSLGLNVVVGFAGLLDLGYVAFYALGAYSLGWFGSDFFFKAHVHVGVHGDRRHRGGHPPQLHPHPDRRGAHLRAGGHASSACRRCACAATTSPSSRSRSARSSASSPSTARASRSAAA